MQQTPSQFSFMVGSEFKYSVGENGLDTLYVSTKNTDQYSTTDHPWRVDVFYKHKQVAIVTCIANYLAVDQAVIQQGFELMTNKLTYAIYDRVSGCKIKLAYE